MHDTLIVGSLVCILIAFSAIEYVTAVKSHRFVIRLLPLSLPVLVLLLCMVITNEALAFFLAVPAVNALAGCCMGWILYRLTKESRRHSDEKSSAENAQSCTFQKNSSGKC